MKQLSRSFSNKNVSQPASEGFRTVRNCVWRFKGFYPTIIHRMLLVGRHNCQGGLSERIKRHTESARDRQKHPSRCAEGQPRHNVQPTFFLRNQR